MAQLKDLLVSGAARFLNGIFVLGTSSMNDTNPAETETYSLGTNNLKWKNIYGKDGYIANVHATNLYDAGGTTTVADKYISKLAVKTTNGTTFTFKGVDGAGGENSAITVPNHANNVAGLVTSGAQTIYGAKTFNSIITASSSTPIQFTATGTGTYNKAMFYSDSNGVTIEVQRASDSSSATALPFLIRSRGGQWNTLKSGPVYINGTSTFGNAGQPIYWNSGVPTAIDWHVGNGSLGEHNANNITYNMIGYYNSNGPSGLGEQATNGAIYVQAYNSNWVGQIAQDYKTGNLFVRGKNNGSWTAWKSIGGGGAIFTYSSSILYDNAKNRFYTNKTDSSWNAQVYSNYGIKDGCSMSFTIDQTTAYIMVGLNTDPKTDASYSSIDYCWYPQSGGALCIYESGNSITCPSGHTTYAAGDEFSIEYVAGFIRYYHNGVLCRQVARAVGSPLYFDSSFHNAGSISAVEFKKITDGENYLQDFHNNYDISTTETVDTKSYLFTAGNTGGWCTTFTKPSGVDNAFGILHAHLHNGNYAMQLGFGGTTDRLYYRNAYATTTWTAWQTLHDSHHDIIPNADLTRNIGSADHKFNNAYLYTLHLRGASSATMTNGTAPANPKIIFSENGGQQVGIVYTDHDAYRASKGLKVMGTDGSDEGNVWLEVQGNIYTGGTTYLNGQTANRLAWTNANKALLASNHYAASDRIAINSASAPGYNFYVNGTSYFNGDLTIPNNHAYYGILGENTSTTASNVGGLTWFNISGTAGYAANVNNTPTSAWWYILRNRHTNTSNNYYTDIAIPFNDTSIYYKIVRDGSVVNNAWIKVLDTNNYTGTLDGRYVNVTGDTMAGALNFTNNKGIHGLMAGGSDYWEIIGSGTEDGGRLKIKVGDNATDDWLDFEFKDWSDTPEKPAVYNPLQMTGNKVIINCRLYEKEWIQFDNYTGLYSPLNNAHFYPNDSTSYGQWIIRGSKGGYSGIQFGNSAGYMTVMDNGNDKGLYQQDQGMWMLYYNKANTSVSLRTASVWWGNAVNISGGLYVNGGNQYVSGYIQSGTRIICGYDSGQAGSISCNNWFYSSGNTGWYNATYGGGWYMTDSTYIRNYGSKTTRLDNLCLGVDNNSYRLYVNGNSWINGYLNNILFRGVTINNSTAFLSSGTSEIFGTTDNTKYKFSVLRMNSSAPNVLRNDYASGIAWKGSDTYGMISVSYGGPNIKIAGGNGTNPVWWIGIDGTSGTTYNLNKVPDSDKLDGYHESSFLRYRDTVSGSGGTSHSNSLWSQIGIRQYNNALPDAMADNATYTWGAVVSLPGTSSRLDIWYNHQTSSNGNGLRYRTGWDNDKRAWVTILDSLNYGAIADGRYVNVTGDTMTGALYVPNGLFRSTGSIPLIYHNGTNIWIGDKYYAENSGFTGGIYLKGTSVNFSNVGASQGYYFYSSASGLTQTGGDITAATGLLKSTKNGNTVAIGSQNNGWCHIYNSANIPFIFNNNIYATNAFKIYNGGSNQSIFGNGYVELYGSTPFIDFHRNNDTGDFSHRIIDSHTDGIDIQRGGSSSGNNWLYITSSSATTTAGIYFTQQGGGWCMQDTTYIRNYNSKHVYITGRLGVDCELRMWGKTRQITKDGCSVSWSKGRDSAIIRETTAEGWHAVVSAKTTNGSWEIGEYNGWKDILVFSYAKDSDYSSGNDTSTKPFYISPTRGIEISSLNYGTSVPSSGETGQIFFKI